MNLKFQDGPKNDSCEIDDSKFSVDFNEMKNKLPLQLIKQNKTQPRFN